MIPKGFKITLIISFFFLTLCSSNNNNFDNFDSSYLKEDVNTSLTEAEIKGNPDKIPNEKTSKLLSTDINKEKGVINAYTQIISLSSKSNNYDNISKIYSESGFEEETIFLDKYYRTNYNSKIKEYIRLGSQKQKNVDKKLNNILLKVIKNALFYEMDMSISDNVFSDKSYIGSPNHWDKAFTYFQAFYPLINQQDNLKITLDNYFSNGADYVYNTDSESQLLLFIESERIKKKLILTFYNEMVKYIDVIIEERNKGKNNYDIILENIIYAGGLFDLLSDNIGDISEKNTIIKEINNTFRTNKELILSKTIKDIFLKEIDNQILNFLKAFQGEFKKKSLFPLWSAYFFYSIIETDYYNRFGQSESENLTNEWVYLITVAKQNNKTQAYLSLENVLKKLNAYKELLSKSLSEANL